MKQNKEKWKEDEAERVCRYWREVFGVIISPDRLAHMYCAISIDADLYAASKSADPDGMTMWLNEHKEYRERIGRAIQGFFEMLEPAAEFHDKEGMEPEFVQRARKAARDTKPGFTADGERIH